MKFELRAFSPPTLPVGFKRFHGLYVARDVKKSPALHMWDRVSNFSTSKTTFRSVRVCFVFCLFCVVFSLQQQYSTLFTVHLLSVVDRYKIQPTDRTLKQTISKRTTGTATLCSVSASSSNQQSKTRDKKHVLLVIIIVPLLPCKHININSYR